MDLYTAEKLRRKLEARNVTMDLFDLKDITTCVACGCTDDHACPGGCAWVAQNLKSLQGICSECLRLGKAALIRVRFRKSPRPEHVAESVRSIFKPRSSASTSSAQSAILRTAHKIFGPSVIVTPIGEMFSVAMPRFASAEHSDNLRGKGTSPHRSNRERRRASALKSESSAAAATASSPATPRTGVPIAAAKSGSSKPATSPTATDPRAAADRGAPASRERTSAAS
jgi:hypothetical protein